MPYNSGAVATERSSVVSYSRMPVPTSSRFSASSAGSYRSSLSERPYYSSSYTSSARSTLARSPLTSEYRHSYAATASRSAPARTSLLSDEAAKRSSLATGSRDRSESRDSAGSARRSRLSDQPVNTAGLTRRISSLDSDFYSKYSPANYVPNSADAARPPLKTSASEDKTSSRPPVSRSPAGAVGGCERRSRAQEKPVDQSSSNNNSCGDDAADTNNNCEPRRLSVAEIRRRFDAAAVSADKEEPEEDEEEAKEEVEEEAPTRRDKKLSDNNGLTGLVNIGNTCFMNSVVQCLSNTKPLLEYLLSDSYVADLNHNSSMKGKLIAAFSEMIHELWSSGGAGVASPVAFKAQISKYAPRFTGYSQQDAQEFLRFLLEGVHEDVNRVKTRPKQLPDSVDQPHTSPEQKSAEQWRRYLRQDDSKIVDLFVGQLRSTLACSACGHCSVTFDPFWDLQLPIPAARGAGGVRLQHCLDHFTTEEVLDGNEKAFCARCEKNQKSTKSFTIQKFPKILVLQLNRFSPCDRYRRKLSVTVDFPLDRLDLGPYSPGGAGGGVYSLYGVANHSGSPSFGHYTAHCRHPQSGQWHEYNDSRVSSVSPHSVVTSEAYLLFYQLTSRNSHL